MQQLRWCKRTGDEASLPLESPGHAYSCYNTVETSLLFTRPSALSSTFTLVGMLQPQAFKSK